MLQGMLTILFFVFFFCAAVIANGYLWRWFYAASTNQDETSYFRTDDGWRLAVHHYRPQDSPPVGPPVILCHGLTANRYIFDLPGSPSLAKYLRSQGRDVWVAELRGSGMSDRPGFFVSDVPYSWTFDDYLTHDVPAIINHVLSRTGAQSIHWVGHSMGGMLICAYLAQQSSARIRSAVTLGSPSDLSKTHMKALRILSRFRLFLKLFPVPPMPFNGRLVLPIANRVPGWLLGLFYPPNIAVQTTRRVVALGSELITSRKLWLDFGRFVDTDRFSPDNGTPYLTNLRESGVPIFLGSGSKDVMAPPDSVSADCDAGPKSGERMRHVFGRLSGAVEDYGHVDLLVGIRAEQEVFPTVLEWLGSHDPKDRETSEALNLGQGGDS